MSSSRFGTRYLDEQRVASALRADPSVTNRGLARTLGLTDAFVGRVRGECEAAGTVPHVEPSRGGRPRRRTEAEQLAAENERFAAWQAGGPPWPFPRPASGPSSAEVTGR